MSRTFLKIKKTAVFFVLAGGIIFGITAGTLLALTRDLPQIRSLESFKPSAVTRIYSADKVLLAKLFVENRDPVPLKSIPSYLKTAIITVEDRNFYRHSGLDIKGILRAIIKDIRAAGFVEGASTITQQLAKTLFLSPKKTLSRKIKEALLAIQLERRYTKDEILELYLNQIYFGSGAYGVESAARLFFGKSVNDLYLAECAMIAAMPKAPSRYSPLVNKDLAIERRNIVLNQMVSTGIISRADYNKALSIQYIHADKNKKALKAPYFVEYTVKFLENTLGSDRIYKGGLTVYTTLSYNLQMAAKIAIEQGLLDLEKRMIKNQLTDFAPQGALIAIDIRSGGILAMVGGRSYYESSFNRATAAKRQPGSAFKPVVYAFAIENGFSQNRMLLDSPIVFKGVGKEKDWKPKNFSRTYTGEITLRKALALSKNIPAVRLIEMLGPAQVAAFGNRLGIETHLSPNLSLALGTSEVTLLDLTSAYAVFPNSGEKIKPFTVLRISDHRNRIIWQGKPEKQIVMSPEGAAITTNMLEGVILEGTGKKAKKLRRPIAGKTGTTNDYKDAYFIGFSPSIAAGVWVGQDNAVSMGKHETGSKAALPIWMEFMSKAMAEKTREYFDIPDNVVKLYIDTTTGRTSADDKRQLSAVLFRKGTEPSIIR